ncbi:MAG: AAA family ATPase [Silicimonas sp.]
MRIRSVTLDNVRRFTDRVSVGPIGDGVTLLCEPNEAGKSTLFDALHALFFLRHGSQTAEVKALRPHSGGKVAVECEIEHEGARWRIRKEWLSGASAKVWRDGVLAHQGDAAEDWISALVAGEAGGPGGLLWVRQGRVSLKAPEKKREADQEFEERRDLLTAISGAMEQVTGGERMDRARDRVVEDLLRLQTPSGRPRTGGRWADAEADVTRLEGEASELERTVADLRDALDRRRRLRSELASLEEPEAVEQRRSDLAEAERALREAEGLAGEVSAAETRAKLARQTAENAKAEAARNARLRKEAGDAAQAHAEAEAENERLAAASADAASVHRAARDRVATLKAGRAEAEAILRRVAHREAAERAETERARLSDIIGRAEEAERERIAARAAAKKGPDKATVDRIEKLVSALAAKEALREAAAPRVTARYQSGAPHMTMGGEPLAEGETRAVPDDGRITVPGIGTLDIAGAEESRAADVAEAREALDEALAEGGWDDPAALHEAGRARAAAERAAELAEQRRDALAPEGIDALRERLAGLGEVRDAAADEALPDRDTAEAALEKSVEALGRAEAAEIRASEMAQTAALRATKAAAAEENARTRLTMARADISDLPDVEPVEQAGRLSVLETEAAEAEAVHVRLAEAAPDIDQLRAHHARLKGVADNAATEAARTRTEIAGLDARIELRGEEGVEEALEEIRGRLAAAHDTLERVVFEKDMLVRLRDALDTAQKAARKTYFAPVARELGPLLAELWDDAELTWSDDTLLPSALVRKGTSEPIDVLSGGTQEQIAFLVRLAFARLLAKAGRHAPLILDDALVYSDDDRIEKMFDALHGAAGDLQILVLSCRQRAFRDLGAPTLSFQPGEGA